MPPPSTVTTDGFASHIHLAPLLLVLTLSQHAGEEGGCCRPHSPSLTPYHSNGPLRQRTVQREAASWAHPSPAPHPSLRLYCTKDFCSHCHHPCCRLASLPHCCRSPSNLCPNRVGALGPQDPSGSKTPAPSSPGPQSLSLFPTLSWGPSSLDPKFLFCEGPRGLSGQPLPFEYP